jgi:hypothetical protein
MSSCPKCKRIDQLKTALQQAREELLYAATVVPFEPNLERMLGSAGNIEDTIALTNLEWPEDTLTGFIGKLNARLLTAIGELLYAAEIVEGNEKAERLLTAAENARKVAKEQYEVNRML